MQIIENKKIDEKMYVETLENGLKVIVFPKKAIKSKYIVCGVNFGSVDNRFKLNGEEIKIPDGTAHYLEHKMFEQKSGKNSLDVLTNLGVDANAFTTNNFTAYLYECTDNFYEALDEYMDYIQNPYYTPENVEKERGIISQEIKMYEDEPEWAVYLNTLKLMYHKNPIRLDIAGTCETIKEINPEILYNIYNNFYVPNEMAIVVVGDFEPTKIISEISKRTIAKKNLNKVERIYEDEPDTIFQKQKEVKMPISIPIFMIGYKDKFELDKEKLVKKDLAIEILSNIIFGKSSELFNRLYNENLILGDISFDYEYARNYAHYIIQAQSENPEKVILEISNEIEKYKKNGISEEDFSRIKKMLFGEYVKSYDDSASIGNSIISNYFKGINNFDFINMFEKITKKDLENVLNEVFNENKKVISIVRSND